MAEQQQQRPTVGRIVHYVSHGTPVLPDGGQVYGSERRAAVVTEVGDGGRVGLAVLNPSGVFFRSLAEGGCDYDDGSSVTGYASGSWHWPERV